jgi:hypothetical protein
MKIAIITFKKLVQDSKEYGSDDEHMFSRVFFQLKLRVRHIIMSMLTLSNLSVLILKVLY